MSDRLADDLAGAILDGREIDWASAASTRNPSERALVPYLRTVARIAELYRDTGAARSLTSTDAGDSLDDGTQASGSFPTQWGHLRLLERIGRGAFGDVFRARDSRLDREVALKLLPEHHALADDGTAIIEEGRLLARVRHRNVVTIYGADRVNDRVGLWMELIRGETLQQAIERGRSFSPTDAITIGIELAGAIGAVHEVGLLHRDVKPHNVMLAEDGRVVLMDFGTGHDSRTGERPVLSGTPLYLAPELLAGSAPSVASDIYSLGMVLFYLLTRSYPVRGENLRDLRSAHDARPPVDVRLRRADVPRRLALAIARALDPVPSRRPSTTKILAAELAAVHRRISPRAVRAVLAGAAVVIVAAGVVMTLRRSNELAGGAAPSAMQRAVPAVAQRPIIAVLPLQNLNGEPESDDFADGLTDEIIRNLAVIDGLEVRSRTSSFEFKDKPRNVTEVAERLHANLIVEGSVLRSGSRIRINAQLVEAAGDRPLWSERFDRELTDIFTIQDDISRAIVNRLRLTLGRGQRRYTVAPDTYELYLKAQTISQRRGTANAQRAVELFRHVLDRDVSFAPAYAGLANAYSFMSMDYFGLDNEEGLSQLRPAAERALELDPLLAEAHAAMGLLRARQREWREAERSFQRALELNPSLTSTHTNYVSSTLIPLGKLDEASRVIAAAMETDPLSLDVQRTFAIVSIVRGAYEDAIVTLRRVLAEDAAFAFADLHLARALTFVGRLQEALPLWDERYNQTRARNGDVRGVQYWSAIAYVRAGRRAEVERWAIGQDRFPYRQAIIYAALGKQDEAFDALRRAIDTQPQRVSGILMAPEFAALRGDPRYAALRTRLDLP